MPRGGHHHHHHHHGHHHHGAAHHHHGAHHHHIHHHPHVSATGTPMGGFGGARAVTPGGHYMGLAICFGMFGIFLVFSGAMMMGTGYAFSIGLGIAGTFMFVTGIILLVLCGGFCRKARQQQNQAIVNQQAGGGTTLVYSQPGAPPTVVQPQAPGAPMAYGQPGMQPIVQPQPPGATSIVYGPGGEVSYQPGAPANFQPLAQPYQPTAPYPSQAPQAITVQPNPSADPAAPPPAYEEAVKQEVPSTDNKDGPT